MTRQRSKAAGWVIDILVGWPARSVLFALLVSIPAGILGLSDDERAIVQQLAAAGGTIVGIATMRLRRRSLQPSTGTRDPAPDADSDAQVRAEVSSVEVRLAQLAALLDAGIMTPAEHDRRRAEVIS